MKRTSLWTLMITLLLTVGLRGSDSGPLNTKGRHPASISKRQQRLDRNLDTILSQHELCATTQAAKPTSSAPCYSALADLRDDFTGRLNYEDYMHLLRENEEDMGLSLNARRQSLASRLALQSYRKSEQPFCERHHEDLDILKTWCKENPCDCGLTAGTIPLSRCDLEIEKCSVTDSQVYKRLFEIDEDDDGTSGLYFSWLTTHGYLQSAKKSKRHK